MATAENHPPPEKSGCGASCRIYTRAEAASVSGARGERRAEGLVLACFRSGWVLPAVSCGVFSVPGSVPERRHILSAPLSSSCEEGPTVHSDLQMRKPRLRSQATRSFRWSMVVQKVVSLLRQL